MILGLVSDRLDRFAELAAWEVDRKPAASTAVKRGNLDSEIINTLGSELKYSRPFDDTQRERGWRHGARFNVLDTGPGHNHDFLLGVNHEFVGFEEALRGLDQSAH